MPTPTDQLRSLPSVSDLLRAAGSLIDRYGHSLTTDAIRDVLGDTRRAILDGHTAPTDPETLLTQVTDALTAQTTPTLRPVINATGVIIHTNLGRAPLSQDAIRAVQQVSRGYSTLEFDLGSGGRGSRNIHPEPLLTDLTGADAALVVNNAAAALVLVLSGLAAEREVIVSRGQLVEIGGGFRIPDIMTQSGARLREVGTTNKTRPDDYQRALTEQTAALLGVHASNFKQVGFTQSAALPDLATIAQAADVWLIDDVGSGALLDTTAFGLAAEPLVQDSITAGADVVLFSGDKLLGGPQAGIIVGKQAAINTLRRHPLARALRADKMALAALVATLGHYQRRQALTQVPVWWMIARPYDELHAIASRWAAQLPHAQVIDGHSTVGGGSIPGSTLPTALLALNLPSATAAVQQLRAATPPVIARIQDDRVLLDPRTVFPGQEPNLLQHLNATINANR